MQYAGRIRYRDHDQPIRKLVDATSALFSNRELAAAYLDEV